MRKINSKILLITCLVTLLPIALGYIFYNNLPDEIAIHFDINNNPNGYFSKNAFVFGMPIIMMIIQVFCCITSDLSDKNPEANKKAITAYKWIIPILSIVLYSITIMYAIGRTIDIRKIVMMILGVIFIIVGNYLPKTIGSNYVKIPKIKDEKINKDIARISGYMLIINGILFMISILFNPEISALLVGLVIVETLGLCAYGIVKGRN